MSDLGMVREEAVKLCKREINGAIRDLYISAFSAGYDLANNKWIPCSKRLPDDEDIKIVTIHDEHMRCLHTDVGWYYNRAERWIVHFEEQNDVVAWMPLPEPWEGADDE